MLKNRKILGIAIGAGTAILIIITIVVFMLVKNKKKNNNGQTEGFQEVYIDTEALEMKFREDFNNEANDYIMIFKSLEKSKVGKYDIKAYVPQITVRGKEVAKINDDIYKLAQSIINKATSVTEYSKYNMEFTSFVNGDILSVVLRFTVKEGKNPRRIIIKTYNYDMVQDKRVKLSEILTNEQKTRVQEKINAKIESANEIAEKSINQGVNAHLRDKENGMYKIENASEFFLGEDNVLYVVYAYGNNEYTEEMDLIMYKL